MVKKPIAVSSCTLLWVDNKQSVSTCWVDSSKSWKMRTGYVSLVTGFEGVYSYRWSILFQVAKLPTHSSSHVAFSRLLRAGCLELNDTRTQRGEFFILCPSILVFFSPFCLPDTHGRCHQAHNCFGVDNILCTVSIYERTPLVTDHHVLILCCSHVVVG